MSDQMNKGSQEELTLLLKIVCFLIPLAGAIMYFVWKNEHPLKSKGACRWAIYGVIFGIVLNVIMMVIGGGAAMLGNG